MQTYDEEVDSELYMIYPRKGYTLKEYEEAVRLWTRQDGEEELFPFFQEVWNVYYVPYLMRKGYEFQGRAEFQGRGTLHIHIALWAIHEP